MPKSKITSVGLFNLPKSNKGVASNLELKNGDTIAQEVQRLARILMGILAKCINEAYKPGGNVKYHRTYKALRSAERYKLTQSIDANSITVRCDMGTGAYHRSYFCPGTANTLLLMDEGYMVNNRAMAHIPWFGWRYSGDIIYKTLKQFKKHNTLGVDVSIRFDRF